jgi:hypothetical protein
MKLMKRIFKKTLSQEMREEIAVALPGLFLLDLLILKGRPRYFTDYAEYLEQNGGTPEQILVKYVNALKASPESWSIRGQIESLVKEHNNANDELCYLMKTYWLNGGIIQSEPDDIHWLAGGLSTFPLVKLSILNTRLMRYSLSWLLKF